MDEESEAQEGIGRTLMVASTTASGKMGRNVEENVS